MAIYLWRVENIRKRRAARYHDPYGPTALCVGLFIAVAVSFGLRFKDGRDGSGGGLKGG